MKKFFTISAAFLLLLAGMHMTLATHFCDGALVATKVSINGNLASCGMVHDVKTRTSAETTFSSNCCEDETNVLKVDENYSISKFQLQGISQHILPEYVLPLGYSYYSENTSITKSTDVSPPENNFANAVSMADICIFRL